MADPDLQIRRGPGHPDPEISGGGGGGVRGTVSNLFGQIFFQFGLKMRGALLNPPLFTTIVAVNDGILKGKNKYILRTMCRTIVACVQLPLAGAIVVMMK